MFAVQSGSGDDDDFVLLANSILFGAVFSDRTAFVSNKQELFRNSKELCRSVYTDKGRRSLWVGCSGQGCPKGYTAKQSRSQVYAF